MCGWGQRCPSSLSARDAGRVARDGSVAAELLAVVNSVT